MPPLILTALELLAGAFGWLLVRVRLTVHRAGRRGVALVLTVAVASLVLIVGVADSSLHPLPPAGSLEADGRVADDLPDTATAGTLAARQFTTRLNTLGRATLGLVGAAKVPDADMGGGVVCQDVRGLVASDGNPAGWPKLTDVQYVAVHSTGTPDSTPLDAFAVANYHVNTAGWEHLGYHVVVLRDGGCQYALDTKYQGYHAFRWNRNSVAMALVGVSDYTPAQLDTYHRLVGAWLRRYGLTDDRVLGHRDFSRLDREALARGERLPTEPNSHVDPCPGSAPCGWERDRLGLNPYLLTAGSTAVSSPQPGEVLVPSLAVRSVVTNVTATYYLPTGRPTSSGQPYTGAAHTAATWLVPPEALPPGDPRLPLCRMSGLLQKVVCPAYPWQSVLRVCRVPQPAPCTRVAITDSGAFQPTDANRGGVDLAPVAFAELAPLTRGRVEVQITVLSVPQ